MTASVTITESIVIDPESGAPYLQVVIRDDQGNVILDELR